MKGLGLYVEESPNYLLAHNLLKKSAVGLNVLECSFNLCLSRRVC